MNKARQHQFLVLTKRTERLLSLAQSINWTENIWMGVSVERDTYLNRIDDLRKVPAHIRWVAFEPLLNFIKSPNLQDIHWAVIGPRRTWSKYSRYDDAAKNLIDHCSSLGIPSYIKGPGEMWIWSEKSYFRGKKYQNKFPLPLKNKGVIY